MLVLTRRIGEEIVIADDICIKVVSISGRRACLGITAPLSVHVTRQEVLERNGDQAPNGHEEHTRPKSMHKK